MKIEIRRWDTKKIIVCGEYESVKGCLEENKDKSFYRADLRYADLRYANLSSADLISANLRYADLRYANLSFANLRYADLRSANLSSADLRYADLRYANLKEPIIFTDIYYLLMFQDKITMRAWKYLNNGKSPYQHKEYEVGKEYTFKDLDKNKLELCGKGGNVATLNWCLKDNSITNEFIEVEFNTKDLIVPYYSDGKFRVSKFKVLRKINRKEAIELIKKSMSK